MELDTYASTELITFSTFCNEVIDCLLDVVELNRWFLSN